MSPKRLPVTITRYRSGRRTRSIASMSTYSASLDVRVLRRDLAKTRRQRPPACSMALALSESVTRSRPRARVLEGGADDPLDALARVDVLLDRHLVRRAALEDASHPDVHPLRVLTEDDEVDVAHPAVLQRA
jgi:hypothetical protein